MAIPIRPSASTIALRAAATLLAVAAFVSLGRWQWERGVHRSAQWEDFANASAEPREVDAAEWPSLERFTRVRIAGQLDGERQILLDNVTEGGRPGWYVLTPLRLANGRGVMVNRGFVPATGYRENLPDVALPAELPQTVQLTGRIGTLPVAGLPSGRQAPGTEGPWPRIASFPTTEDLARVLTYPLEEGVLLLDADGGPGYLRQWRPPGLDPKRHYAYAVQWWGFAVLAIVLFAVLGFRRRPE